jgi:hypothetical protein
MRLDLDAARAARAAKAEAEGEAHVLVLGGQEFELPTEMPLDFVLAAAEGDVAGSLRVLLGEEEYENLRAKGLSVSDLNELIGGLAEVYGLEDVGEALASGDFFSKNGKPSRPTSKRSTASTSARKSGGRKK